ncbi:MAG TPA: hypothetical protein VIL07_00210 [Symbiobacteriaceae bacterium]
MTRHILGLTGLIYPVGVGAVILAGNAVARCVEASLPDAPSTVELIAAMRTYDQFVDVATLLLAIYLGIWTAAVGLYTGKFLLGFGLLGAGVAGTAVALSFMAPAQLPGISYPATAIWLFGNVFIYFGAWMVTSVAGILRASAAEEPEAAEVTRPAR